MNGKQAQEEGYIPDSDPQDLPPDEWPDVYCGEWWEQQDLDKEWIDEWNS